ncbi:MAG: DeoR/GlpR family DNA-binding transcription regulator [Clostridium sp.]|nr:DeoR/GlpR family DNA-binding transcription regulator [Clostridium sp.]
MFAEERQLEIVSIIQKKGSIKVNELSNYFNVSEATVRRDLQEMESRKLLKRTHGGALKTDITNFEPSFLQKKDERRNEKESIGKSAAAMIKNGDTIMLDSGTTTLEIAKNITVENITVLTNSIDIAAELIERKNIELILTGGNFRVNTRAMVGSICEATIKNFRVDKAFIGANGISLEQGVTTPNYEEAQCKRAMIKSSLKPIIVADSSKFENVCFSLICPIKSIYSIITGGDISDENLDPYRRMGIKIMR